MKLMLISLCALLMTGCAGTGQMYQWGSYDELLYQSYKSADKSVEFRQRLELHITKMEQAQQKVAPGLYGELGTLYLQAGDNQRAVAMYAKEREVWPESRGLMDALIKNVDQKSADKAGAKS